MIAFVFSTGAFAQKLGYINSLKILSEFKDAKEAQEKLQEMNQEWERQGRELQQQFQELNEQLESQSLLLSEERKKEKTQELQELAVKLQRYQQEIWGQNGEAAKKEAELMQPVYEKINAAIRLVGEKEKFDYIFDSVNANIVYASPSQPDLTDLVLEELEKGVQTSKK
jgi:outer membrane protein